MELVTCQTMKKGERQSIKGKKRVFVSKSHMQGKKGAFKRLLTWLHKLTFRYDRRDGWRKEQSGKPFLSFTQFLYHISHFPFFLCSILAVSSFHLNVYLCHSKLNFCLSLHCLTPLFSIIPPPSYAIPPCPFMSPSISPIKSRYYKTKHSIFSSRLRGETENI